MCSAMNHNRVTRPSDGLRARQPTSGAHESRPTALVVVAFPPSPQPGGPGAVLIECPGLRCGPDCEGRTLDTAIRLLREYREAIGGASA